MERGAGDSDGMELVWYSTQLILLVLIPSFGLPQRFTCPPVQTTLEGMYFIHFTFASKDHSL